MIVPMKKVVLVTTETRKSDSIAKLQDFGLLHIEQLAGSGERLEELKKPETWLIVRFYPFA